MQVITSKQFAIAGDANYSLLNPTEVISNNQKNKPPDADNIIGTQPFL